MRLVTLYTKKNGKLCKPNKFIKFEKKNLKKMKKSISVNENYI